MSGVAYHQECAGAWRLAGREADPDLSVREGGRQIDRLGLERSAQTGDDFGQDANVAPLHERPYCFSHDPERAEEAAEARRIGGLRRKKEGTIAVAYDLPGLDTVAGIRRLLEIVVTDGIGLENGIARLRVLISTAVAAAKLLETGELEDRIATLEQAVGVGRQASPEPKRSRSAACRVRRPRPRSTARLSRRSSASSSLSGSTSSPRTSSIARSSSGRPSAPTSPSRRQRARRLPPEHRSSRSSRSGISSSSASTSCTRWRPPARRSRPATSMGSRPSSRPANGLGRSSGPGVGPRP